MTLEAALKHVCQKYFNDAIEDIGHDWKWASGDFTFDTTHKTIKLYLKGNVIKAVEHEEVFEF